MIFGLRKMAGVSLSRFEREFGVSMEEVYGEVIRRYVALKLLEVKGDAVRLTTRASTSATGSLKISYDCVRSALPMRARNRFSTGRSCSGGQYTPKEMADRSVIGM